MALEIVLMGGEKYKGLRRFAVRNKDTDPEAVDTTPKLLLGIDLLPPGFDLSQYDPKRIARPAEAEVRVEDLYTSPTSRAPYGIEVKLAVRDQYILLTEDSAKRPNTVMDPGTLGRLNRDLRWQVPGFVFDEEFRHRCEIIIGEIASVKAAGPSAAAEFVKKHYFGSLDPKPVTRP